MKYEHNLFKNMLEIDTNVDFQLQSCLKNGMNEANGEI